MMRAFLSACVGLAFAASAWAQSFNDLDFEQECDTCASGSLYWRISWQSPNVRCHMDNVDGQRALLISSTAANGVGLVEQAAALTDTAQLHIVKLSAMMRSEGVEGGRGAGLYFTGCDAEGRVVFSQDLGFGSFKWALGTRAAQRYTIQAICPTGVSVLKLGLILYGQGRVWFDDVVFTSSTLEGRTPSPQATAYIDAACDTIRLNSLRKDSVDLPALRAMALRIAGDANDPADHHLAVGYLLQGLEDHHSFLMEPDVAALWQGGGDDTAPIAPVVHRVIQGCGYIAIPPFMSNDSALIAAFVDTIQQALSTFDAQGVKGWIIDQRNNTGGNMAPMVCGLGPLFDPGVLGQLVDVNGHARRWSYANGSYGWDGEEEVRAPHPVVLSQQRPIAVLIGPRTGSSGESSTICFVGNSRTRLFGDPTWGLTTGNGSFDLPDGAKMFLASTVMADRNGHVFHGPIAPDERVDQPADWSYDAALEAALRWIERQP
jgi:hypothetical protein